MNVLKYSMVCNKTFCGSEGEGCTNVPKNEIFLISQAPYRWECMVVVVPIMPHVICCRNMTSNFCCNKSGMTQDCSIQIRLLSAFWTASTIKVTYGCLIRTFTCMVTLSHPSGLYGSLWTCTMTAELSTQPGRVVEIYIATPIRIINIGLECVKNYKSHSKWKLLKNVKIHFKLISKSLKVKKCVLNYTSIIEETMESIIEIYCYCLFNL